MMKHTMNIHGEFQVRNNLFIIGYNLSAHEIVIGHIVLRKLVIKIKLTQFETYSMLVIGRNKG
jgi:hypothetical protein